MKCAYTCTECGAEFEYRAAYCEDWRDKNLKFACPQCHTFFRETITTVTAKGQSAIGALLVTGSIAAFFLTSGGFSWPLLGFSISSATAAFCIFGPARNRTPRLVLIRVDSVEDCDEITTH